MIESDVKRFESLQNEVPPFNEPGVVAAFSRHRKEERLRLFQNSSDCIDNPDVIIMADSNIMCIEKDNSSHLNGNIEWAFSILKNDSYAAIMIVADAQLGLCSMIKDRMVITRPDLQIGRHYDIILNPNFIHEESCIRDFLLQNWILIGIDTKSDRSVAVVSRLYATAINAGAQVFYTDCRTARFIKYSAAALELSRIALLNELKDLCCKAGGNAVDLIGWLALDPLIRRNAPHIPPGFEDASHIRSLRHLENLGTSLSLDLDILSSIEKSNARRLARITRKIIFLIGKKNSVQNKKIAFFGLSSRGQSSDLSMAPSIVIMGNLLAGGARVSVYDPSFTDSTMRCRIPAKIMMANEFSVSNSMYEAIEQSDMLVIAADCPEFALLDSDRFVELLMRSKTKKPIVLDLVGTLCKADFGGAIYVSQSFDLFMEDSF
jgi:UDPglucose 6-dehydrogenase